MCMAVYGRHTGLMDWVQFCLLGAQWIAVCIYRMVDSTVQEAQNRQLKVPHAEVE